MAKINWFQSPYSKDLPTIHFELGEAEKLRIILEFYIYANENNHPCVKTFAQYIQKLL